MAKIRRGEKTAAVTEYLDAHPEAGPKEIVAALAKQRIKIPRPTSAISRASSARPAPRRRRRRRTKKRAARKSATVEVAAAPAVVEKPTTNGGTITLDQVKKVAHTISMIGGYHRVTEVLEVIKELGGVKKFKGPGGSHVVPHHGRHPVLSSDFGGVPETARVSSAGCR